MQADAKVACQRLSLKIKLTRKDSFLLVLSCLFKTIKQANLVRVWFWKPLTRRFDPAHLHKKILNEILNLEIIMC